MTTLVALLLSPIAAAQDASAGMPEPTLQLQTWVTAFDQDQDPTADPNGYGDPEHDVGIGIARARVGMTGETDTLSYDITVGTTSPYDGLTVTETDVAIIGAILTGKSAIGDNELRLSVGAQRIPFGRERLLSSKDLLFQERAVGVQWTAPGYQAGAMADFELDMGLRIRAGVFNGGEGLYGDNNDGLTIAGRLEWANGDHYTRMPKAGTMGFAASVYQDTGLATNSLGIGGDLFARFGPLLISAEGTSTSINPTNNTIDLPTVLTQTSRLGVTAQVSVVSDMDRGGIEFGGRFSMLDDNSAIKDNGDVGIVHAGLTRWDIQPGLDLGAGFIHREELGGRALGNDTMRLWAQVRWPINSDAPEADVAAAPAAPTVPAETAPVEPAAPEPTPEPAVEPPAPAEPAAEAPAATEAPEAPEAPADEGSAPADEAETPENPAEEPEAPAPE